MAILQPTLLQAPAFDATSDYTFRFTMPSGSDQVVKNRLIIVDQSNDTEVYNELITTSVLSHTVVANILDNSAIGNIKQYSATLIAYNSNNDASQTSSPILFYCYVTPTFELTNTPSIVTNGSFAFELTYSQDANELLDAYTFNLYDVQGTLVQTSNVIYVGDNTSPFYYTFNGLLNNTSYSIQATGITVNSTELSTDIVDFVVEYTQPSASTLITLQSNNCGGYVLVTSNMSTIDGTATPDPPTYINDEKIDLSAEGANVVWQDGVVFSGNFRVQIWFEPENPNQPITQLVDNNGDILTIRYCEGYEDGGDTLMAYADGTLSNGVWSYYIYSSYIDLPTSGDNLQVVITKKDNLFNIDLYNLT